MWNEIAQRLGRWIFILPVLAFTGMEPDRDIEARGGLAKVNVIWGTERFVERLMGLAERSGLFHPPTAEEIEAESEAVTSGGKPPLRQGQWTSLPGRWRYITPTWSTSTPRDWNHYE